MDVDSCSFYALQRLDMHQAVVLGLQDPIRDVNMYDVTAHSPWYQVPYCAIVAPPHNHS
jgi:hypothetical protein